MKIERIFEYIRIFFEFLYSNTVTNIFIQFFLTQMNFRIDICDQYIQIFEFDKLCSELRHSKA